jgi:heme/copper-type cytochrome/quinol oxidase subunit 4
LSNTLLSRFITQFVLYILIVAGISAFPLYKLADQVILEGLAASFLLFFFLTVASFALIIRKSAKNGTQLLTNYFGSIGLKMIVALVYFIVMLKGFKGDELTFALTFFAAYLICTCFEVYYIMHNLRQI